MLKALSLLVVVFAASLASVAVASEPRLSQYGHTSWRVQDGLFASPNALTQSKDGYLWLGTDAGLLRFDGVRFVPKNTYPEGSLAERSINALVTAKDGSLWVGGPGGVAHIKDGHLALFDIPGNVQQMVEDDAGTLWVVLTRVNGRMGPLCHVDHIGLHCERTPNLPMLNASAVFVDHAGAMWVGGGIGVCRWHVDKAADCYLQEAHSAMSSLIGVTAIGDAPDGDKWVANARAGPELGLGQLHDGQWKTFVTAGIDGRTLSVESLFTERSGALWIGTIDKGLYRVRGDQVDHVDAAGGLTSNTVSSNGIFEDREGTVWVLTAAGIDAFHRLPLSVFSTSEGLPADRVEAVLPARDGSVWISGAPLVRLVDDRPVPTPVPDLFAGKAVTALLEDHAGRLWIGLNKTLNVLDHGALRRVTSPSGGDIGAVLSMVEDTDHFVWVVTIAQDRHVWRFGEPGAGVAMDDPRYKALFAMKADPTRGIWFGSTDGSLEHDDGERRTVYPPDAVSHGTVRDIDVAVDGTVLAATSQGLLVQRGSVRRLLAVSGGLPCSRLGSVLRDARGGIWMSASCGLIRIDAGAWDAWFAHPDERVVTHLLDASSGAQSGNGSFSPHAAIAPDGRLWFATGKAAEVIDPVAAARVAPAPHVAIEEITADRTVFALGRSVRLPPRTRDLDIRYTALSTAVPQQVNFQYRLEGRDPEWLVAGTRRQAFYSDLSPGSYRFRVRATNKDGASGDASADAEADVDLVIPPLFYQTTWFAILCVIAVLAAIFGALRAKVANIEARTRDRIATQHAERERIARDLHDTLLQSTEGLVLRFQAALDRMKPDDPGKGSLRLALDRADAVMAEGRDRVHDLRTSGSGSAGLARSFASLVPYIGDGGRVSFNIEVEGSPREFAASVEDEICRIGQEAILNAFRHAEATAIQVQIVFTASDFRLRVIDDGKGILDNDDIAGSGSRHWGVKGMKERAIGIGGELRIDGRAGSGTTLALLVPAARAYRRTDRRFAWLVKLRRMVA